VYGLGCMPTICSGNEKNDLRPCPDSDGTCGHYHGKRHGGRLLDGVDILCRAQASVHAPFDGQLYFWRPYGGRTGYACADHGVRIDGTGQWQGYYALIASITPVFFGGKVKRGQMIGKSIGASCIDEVGDDFQDYVQLRLYRQGVVVDPTYHLRDCMCTGQICESNAINKLVGQPFKADSRYNGVRGWDIRCPMMDEDESSSSSEETERRAPWIYAPIDGEAIGRIRLRQNDTKYEGCDNDGLFIVGTGAWQDFEVRLFNVQFRTDLGLGRKAIVQGQPIAKRLTCVNAPDSVYVEARYRGQVIDISAMIAADKCQLPELPLM